MSVVDEAYVRKISDLEESNENLQSYVKRLEVQLQEYQLELPEFQSNVEDQKETESDRPLPVRSIDRSLYTIHEFTFTYISLGLRDPIIFRLCLLLTIDVSVLWKTRWDKKRKSLRSFDREQKR